jgi:hypothetical protein
VTGGPEGQALPITSTQSKHLRDALGWAYDRLGLDVATGGIRICYSNVPGAADAQWLPQWLPEAARTGRGCWLSAKRGFDKGNVGAPGGIRTPPF